MTYKTDTIATVKSLPTFSRSVYEWLLTTGWYNFDGESGFSDVDAQDVATALGCKVLAVNAALGHLMDAGLVHTDLYENTGMEKVGRTYKMVVVASFQIIYTAHNDGEPAHDDLLAYRENELGTEPETDAEAAQADRWATLGAIKNATADLMALATNPKLAAEVATLAAALLATADKL